MPRLTAEGKVVMWQPANTTHRDTKAICEAGSPRVMPRRVSRSSIRLTISEAPPPASQPQRFSSTLLPRADPDSLQGLVFVCTVTSQAVHCGSYGELREERPNWG
ncbi:hypothetical protein NDU88_003016 [Pleurodeles waltl]|uniref:Uncharacterized protein n=1 Tax=Pleurodeles waltl TaxID=8319 RepID=A0AAV7P8C4_PLEWA|nr:hypothetical protein NDU88_003016 [Pleurodeles waltl]